MEEIYTIYQPSKIKPTRKYFNSNFKIFIFLFLIKFISNELYSEIQLVIRGNGNQELVNNGFNPVPSEIYVNGEKKDEDTRTCELEGETNNITLRFNVPIFSCVNMFKNLRNITTINLSDFDTSKVSNMNYMFYGCSNLEFIYFGNINTNFVINMTLLFFSCSKLKSIDISKLKN